MLKNVKKYLLLGMAMTVVLCCLTACRSDDYNESQTESSVSSSDDESAGESNQNVRKTDGEEVYEYQQIIDEDGNGGGQAEYSFRFSDAEDAD